MNNSDFLKFNDQEIQTAYINGQYWIAIKPLCEAIGVDYIRQAKNIRTDEILSLLRSNQTLVASDQKKREMLCLPEMYIYGWLFSIRSKNAELTKYKRECYRILFEHFHGTLTKRKQILGERGEIEEKIRTKKAEIAETDLGQSLKALELKKRNCSAQLVNLDKSLSDKQIKLPI